MGLGAGCERGRRGGRLEEIGVERGDDSGAEREDEGGWELARARAFAAADRASGFARLPDCSPAP